MKSPNGGSTALPWLAWLALLVPVVAGAQVQSLRISLETMRVHALPLPPGGGDWDGSILGNLFSGDLLGMYPDIEICVGSRQLCQHVCVNAQLYADDPARATVCGLQFEGGLPIAELRQVAGRAEPERKNVDVAFQVNEFDATSADGEPRRIVARFSLLGGAQPLLPEPENCTSAAPCKVDIPTARGPLVVSFTTSYRGIVGSVAPPGEVQAPAAAGQPPAPAIQAPAGEEPSLIDATLAWLKEKIWGKVEDAAGKPGTVIKGLAEQGEARDEKYLQCLRRAVGVNQLGPAFNSRCLNKTGLEAEQCAEQLLGENHPDAIGSCRQGEGIVGFLANMWKSACGFVGLTCK